MSKGGQWGWGNGATSRGVYVPLKALFLVNLGQGHFLTSTEGH